MAKAKKKKARRGYKKPLTIKTEIPFTERELRAKVPRGQEYTVSYTKSYSVDYSKSEVA